MCILLKLHYAKFDVSKLFCSKGIEKILWGSARPPPPLVKEGLIIHNCESLTVSGLDFRAHDYDKTMSETILVFNPNETLEKD